MTTKSRIYEIIGEQLSAVSFVMDYVEFQFDGPKLIAFTNLTVEAQDAASTFPKPGSRDVLCSLIGTEVTDVIVQDDEMIEIRFGNSGVIRVPLSQSVRLGPEAAHFIVPQEHVFEVW